MNQRTHLRASINERALQGEIGRFNGLPIHIKDDPA